MKKVIRYGTEYGGFFYPEDLEFLEKKSTIYCIGVGEDVSHDIILCGKLNCDVFLFDPTPRSKEHIDLVKYVLKTQKEPNYDSKVGGGDNKYWNLIINSGADPEKIIFEPSGVYVEDAEMLFYPPENPAFVSHSLVNKNNVEYAGFTAKVKKISTIMKEYNHSKIDLLKLDVEGVECEIINQIIDEKIFPKYISVDFDSNIYSDFGNKKIEECIKKLLNVGYNIIWKDKNNYSFLKD